MPANFVLLDTIDGHLERVLNVDNVIIVIIFLQVRLFLDNQKMKLDKYIVNIQKLHCLCRYFVSQGESSAQHRDHRQSLLHNTQQHPVPRPLHHSVVIPRSPLGTCYTHPG